LSPPLFKLLGFLSSDTDPPFLSGGDGREGEGMGGEGRGGEKRKGRGGERAMGGQYLEEVYAYDRMNSCNDFRVMAQTSSLTLQ